jgi:O-antigen ligase
MLITQGILGFAAFLYMICTPLIKAGRVRNNRIITYLMIFIAIILLRGLVESVFQYSDMILWAMVVAVEFEAEKENRKDVTVEDV